MVINELRRDQGGTDYDEYFELKGTAGQSLNGLTYIVLGDSADGSGVVEAVIDLTGQTIGASGLFVAAEKTFTLGTADFVTSINFENNDNVTHLLVGNFSGENGDDLDVDDDGVLDTTPWAFVVDDLSIVGYYAKGEEGEHTYSSTVIGPDGKYHPGQIYRCGNDAGTWAIGIWGIGGPPDGTDTPGAENVDCEGGTECPADLNGDGVVNVTDLLAVIDGWGGADGDVDGDGTTGVADLLAVIDGWGACP